MRRMKRSKLVRNTLLGIVAAFLGGGLILLFRKRDKQQARSQLSPADEEFVKQAAQEDLAEVELGHLAGLRGQNQTIRQLGQRLVKEHGQTHSELVSLA